MKMNSELDAQVATEVMGWTILIEPKHPSEVPDGIDPAKLAYLDSVSRRLGLQRYVAPGPHSAMWWFKEWHPSSDIAATFEMEAEIERRGLGNRYAVWLVNEMQGDNVSLFGLLRATPEQRCRAALAAVRSKVPA